MALDQLLKRRRIPKHLSVDVLTPNQTEAAALTGIEVTDVASARAAAQARLDRGAAAVVKLGELGAFYASREGSGHVPTELGLCRFGGHASPGACGPRFGHGWPYRTCGQSPPKNLALSAW